MIGESDSQRTFEDFLIRLSNDSSWFDEQQDTSDAKLAKKKTKFKGYYYHFYYKNIILEQLEHTMINEAFFQDILRIMVAGKVLFSNRFHLIDQNISGNSRETYVRSHYDSDWNDGIEFQ